MTEARPDLSGDTACSGRTAADVRAWHSDEAWCSACKARRWRVPHRKDKRTEPAAIVVHAKAQLAALARVSVPMPSGGISVPALSFPLGCTDVAAFMGSCSYPRAGRAPLRRRESTLHWRAHPPPSIAGPCSGEPWGHRRRRRLDKPRAARSVPKASGGAVFVFYKLQGLWPAAAARRTITGCQQSESGRGTE